MRVVVERQLTYSLGQLGEYLVDTFSNVEVDGLSIRPVSVFPIDNGVRLVGLEEFITEEDLDAALDAYQYDADWVPPLEVHGVSGSVALYGVLDLPPTGSIVGGLPIVGDLDKMIPIMRRTD